MSKQSTETAMPSGRTQEVPSDNTETRRGSADDVDPDDRWQSAGDLGHQLKIIQSGSQPSVVVPVVTAAPQRASWRQAMPWMLTTLAVGSLLIGIAVWSLTRPATPTSPPTSRLVISLPATDELVQTPNPGLALSPDGRTLVYVASRDGVNQLYRRPLDQLDPLPIPGTDGANNPMFSPDGRSVGFVADGALRKVSLAGGPPVTICYIDGSPHGASWGSDDTIIFATVAPTALWRVAAAGGEPEQLTMPDAEQGELDHRWPEILPGGEAVLFTITPGGAIENAQIAVLFLADGEQRVLIPGGSNPRYVPTGHIAYGVGGTLRAVSFDLSRLEVTSDPIPVVDGMNTKASGAANFGVAQDGSLVYVANAAGGGTDRNLILVQNWFKELQRLVPTP